MGSEKEITSGIFRTRVWHRRNFPARNEFSYRFFHLLLDLKEIPALFDGRFLASAGAVSLFRFYPPDYLRWQPASQASDYGDSLKEYVGKVYSAVLNKCKKSGADVKNTSQILLLTNVRTAGYNFNPVSFYFCLDQNRSLLAILAEVSNTFGEQKAYVIGSGAMTTTRDNIQVKAFARKDFYVSPFTHPRAGFEFNFQIKTDFTKIQIKISTINSDREDLPELEATLHGTYSPWSKKLLVREFARIPFATLKTIWLIHWQAFRLWVKRVPWWSKHRSDKILENA